MALILTTAIVAQNAETKEVQEKKITLQPSELPTPVKDLIDRQFAGGKFISIEKEVQGEDPGQYDIELTSDGKTYEIEISAEGKIVETKEITARQDAAAVPDKKWTSSFGEENCTFVTTGKNRFFVLEPGFRLTLESRSEKVVITVLNETVKIGSIQTRVVEEREEENGKLKEVSRNFYAICKEHGDVFYFGEEVDDYEDGKIVAHSGQWKAGEKDCRAGIMMPGTALLGARHYQEIAPNAKDRAEIIRDDVTLTTPAGTFKSCIVVEETSGLDPKEKGSKTYAPGIGLIQDEDLLLTGFTQTGK
jgi:hypothetical protein